MKRDEKRVQKGKKCSTLSTSREKPRLVLESERLLEKPLVVLVAFLALLLVYLGEPSKWKRRERKRKEQKRTGEL